MLQTGIRGEKTALVTQHNVASAVGSGALPVYATPMMIALMEMTAAESVQPFLEEGQGTVGTLVNVRHVSATPLGMTVRCESTLTNAEGKRLTFSVAAYDDAGLIGQGIHERYVVDGHRFMSQAEKKRAPANEPQ